MKCKDDHEILLNFHLSPDCIVSNIDNKLCISFKKGFVYLLLPKGFEVNVYEGNKVIPLGWYSPSYDVKVPSKTISARKRISGLDKFETKFNVEFSKGCSS
jgi:hypothetical protein